MQIRTADLLITNEYFSAHPWLHSFIYLHLFSAIVLGFLIDLKKCNVDKIVNNM